MKESKHYTHSPGDKLFLIESLITYGQTLHGQMQQPIRMLPRYQIIFPLQLTGAWNENSAFIIYFFIYFCSME
ncbi:MAG: hypothetical protein Ct9H90mP20_0470 [Candidatus Neomarinimicrobiota bacterium]|nr:MAG: hypothetical protein Ct9H90mP20_0470 [Candidatus Neomarinimicrobiota bacterium]